MIYRITEHSTAFIRERVVSFRLCTLRRDCTRDMHNCVNLENKFKNIAQENVAVKKIYCAHEEACVFNVPSIARQFFSAIAGLKRISRAKMLGSAFLRRVVECRHALDRRARTTHTRYTRARISHSHTLSLFT